MKKFFSPFRYFKPEKYEEWFEELAKQGYHPKKINHFSSICMNFQKSEPKKYKYAVDLQSFPKKEYIPTYESFGWELIGKMSGMYIWRKEYTDEKPEAFSDKESLEKRNSRFLKAIAFSAILMIILSAVLWITYLNECQFDDSIKLLPVFGSLTSNAALILFIIANKISNSN